MERLRRNNDGMLGRGEDPLKDYKIRLFPKLCFNFASFFFPLIFLMVGLFSVWADELSCPPHGSASWEPAASWFPCHCELESVLANKASVVVACCVLSARSMWTRLPHGALLSFRSWNFQFLSSITVKLHQK